MNIDLTKVCDLKWDGIDGGDHPDYVDAYISEGWIETDVVIFTLLPLELTSQHKGRYFRRLTESELDFLNESNPDWRYEQLMKWIH